MKKIDSVVNSLLLFLICCIKQDDSGMQADGSDVTRW